MTISVYRVFDMRDQLLYVGQTSNLVNRLEAHRKAGVPWARGAYQVTVETAPDRESAIELERQTIAAEHPRFNVCHNGRPSDYTLGPWLREQRERFGISLRDLATKARLDPGYVSRVERSEKPLPLKTGARLMTAIGEIQNRRAS